jgi:G protein-coupled receptor 107
VDILCCCAVLIPIVWQVNELEKSVGLEEEYGTDLSERESALESADKGQILAKLKVFRTFYLVVVAYIYTTRIVVYVFAAMLDYRHLWVRHFVIEIVTLSFYFCVGLMFRPVSENAAYQSVKSDDAVENGVELRTRSDGKKH